MALQAEHLSSVRQAPNFKLQNPKKLSGGLNHRECEKTPQSGRCGGKTFAELEGPGPYTVEGENQFLQVVVL